MVCIDDSIVRGTTLKQYRKFSVATTAQVGHCLDSSQIRYPDCYGIDMSELGKFIAQAAVALIAEGGYEGLLEEVAAMQGSLEGNQAGIRESRQEGLRELHVAELSAKVAELVCPDNGNGKVPVEIVYQSIENLHDALLIIRATVFTGDYPTLGVPVVHSFLNFYEKKEGRSY